MVIGGPGSGKSTLARWLGDQTGLPAQHMDVIHWKPGWVERTRAQKLPLIAQVEARERWIIEGGLSATYENRAARAEMIIWLDLPVGLRLWRVLKRGWRYKGQTRPDLTAGCPERFGLETLKFMWWIWCARHASRSRIARLVGAQSEQKKVHHLATRAAVRAFQADFNI